MGKILLTVDDRIRFGSPLPKAVEANLIAAHEYANPDVGKRIAMGFSVYGVPAKLKTWRRDDDGALTLPRGGMHKVRAILDAHSIAYQVKDARHEGLPVSERSRLRYVGPPMRDYQDEMVAAGLKHEQCVIRAATAAGKTYASFKLLAEIGLNALVILPTSQLFEQWHGQAEMAFGISGDQLGIIQGAKRRLRPLTIAMQQTMANRIDDEIKGFFGCVLCDETQRAGADSLFKVVDQMPARYRIGVSASEKRKDRKECLVYDLFSKVVYEAGRELLTKRGFIMDVEMRLVPTRFAADWYGMQNDDLNFNRLLDEMTACDERNKIAIDLAIEEVARGERVVLLTHRREHAKALARAFVARGIASGLLLGDGGPGDAEEFERTKAGIQSGDVRIGVGTYGAMGYGIDLPAASVGIAVTPIASNEQGLNQARGRFCRMAAGKKGARMYLLMDTRVYAERHVRSVVGWYKGALFLDRGEWVDAKQWLAGKRRVA